MNKESSEHVQSRLQDHRFSKTLLHSETNKLKRKSSHWKLLFENLKFSLNKNTVFMSEWCKSSRKSLFCVCVDRKFYRFPHVEVQSQGGERLQRRPGLRGRGADSAAGVAAGLAVVPVAAQVHLQGQQAVGGGPVLAALIWDKNQVENFSV